MSGTKCMTLAVNALKATPGNRLSHSLQQRSQKSVIGTTPWGWKPSTYRPEKYGMEYDETIKNKIK